MNGVIHIDHIFNNHYYTYLDSGIDKKVFISIVASQAREEVFSEEEILKYFQEHDMMEDVHDLVY